MNKVEKQKLAGKGISLVLAILGVFFVKEIYDIDVSRSVFIFAITLESLVFVNSISPLAIGTIVSANSLVHSADYIGLVLGYLFAYGANVTSFFIGRFVGGGQHPQRKLTWSRFFATYWHPQLASICAFDCGVERANFTRFLILSIPVSAVYYCAVCLALGSTTNLTTSLSSPWVAVALLALWIAYELRGLLSAVQQSPPPN